MTKLLVTIQGIGGNVWIPKHIFEEIYSRKPTEQELLSFGAQITNCETCNTWTTHEYLGQVKVSNVGQNFQCTKCKSLKLLIYYIGSGSFYISIKKYDAREKPFQMLQKEHKRDPASFIIPKLKAKPIPENMASLLFEELKGKK